jgi:hypothetical protein
LEENVPSVLAWPANSADLSPIENVWTIVKDVVEKSLPKNINEFRDAIVTSWNQIDADLTSRLIAAMPARLKACRDQRGEEINLKFI